MDSLRAKVDAAATRLREQYKVVGEKAAQAVKQPKRSQYQSVQTSEVDSDTVFSIDDSDGTHIEFNLARLNAQHAELLRQAKRSISATESQVRWLRDERLQHEQSLQKLHEEYKTDGIIPLDVDSPIRGGIRRKTFKKCRGMCVIL
uniref:Uncharacterized protein n=1 Tax=Strombidinopsis acuminata TaxID=141414 RepID=A0A7S3SGV7_9SPIT